MADNDDDSTSWRALRHKSTSLCDETDGDPNSRSLLVEYGVLWSWYNVCLHQIFPVFYFAAASVVTLHSLMIHERPFLHRVTLLGFLLPGLARSSALVFLSIKRLILPALIFNNSDQQIYNSGWSLTCSLPPTAWCMSQSRRDFIFSLLSIYIWRSGCHAVTI